MNAIRKKHSTYSETEQAVKNRLRYWKLVKEKQDAHEAKVKSVVFRHNLLTTQKKINYQNEYDRLRGELAHTVVPEQSKEVIRKRLRELFMFGADIA